MSETIPTTVFPPSELNNPTLIGLNPEIGHDYQWFQQMLTLRAVQNYGVVYDFNMRGMPLIGVDEFIAAYAPLGGRLVSDNVQGDITAQPPPDNHPRSIDDDGDPDEDRNWKRHRYIWNDACMNLYVSADSAEVSIYSLDKALVERVTEIAAKTITESIASNGKAYVLVQTQTGIEFESIGIAAVEFEPTNYTQEVVDGYRHVVKDLKEKEPCGRISVFDGVPGTGKTYLVRALLNDVHDALFLLVTADLVPALASPGLVQSIIRRRTGRKGPTVFIVEDADTALAKRGADNMSSVSAVLNLSDGLLGNMLDLRIVATTNAERNDIDEAVMRDGRLCRRIEVPPLDYDRAVECLARLKGDVSLLDKKQEYSLGQLYRLARSDRHDGAAKEIKKKGVMGFGS